ncbi:MAG TPA: Tim44/TimA family putative adaptor protein [Geminicoccaceae bacterium]|nr:Tim44/TimA family putative adaptor protein [Geminicoccaceae bacterium]
MSEGFAYIDILFFAMVAAFIALRLRSVLGRRTGHERRRTGPVGRPEGANDNVVAMPGRAGKAETEAAIANLSDGAVKSGLTQIRLADAQFDLPGFQRGARQAFEMIVDAFAAGDKGSLRPLLAPDVFDGFARAIDARQAAGHVLDTQLISVKSAEVVEAGMNGSRARATVRFVSDQINVTRDAGGQVVAGDPDRSEEVVDLWTFERDTRSDDPNWELVETRTPE